MVRVAFGFAALLGLTACSSTSAPTAAPTPDAGCVTPDCYGAERVAVVADRISSLQVDDEAVYWMAGFDQGPYSVWRKALAGGDPVKLADVGQEARVIQLGVLDGAKVVMWGGHALYAVPRAGGTVSQRETSFQYFSVGAIAAWHDDVFSQGLLGGGITRYSAVKELNGGIAAGTFGGLAAGSQYAYTVVPGGAAYGVPTDPRGTPVTFSGPAAPNAPYATPRGFAAYGGAGYFWVRKVQQVGAAGGDTPSGVYRVGAAGTFAIAEWDEFINDTDIVADATGVYLCTSAGLTRIRLDGAREALLPACGPLALSRDYVYLGNIYRIPKSATGTPLATGAPRTAAPAPSPCDLVDCPTATTCAGAVYVHRCGQLSSGGATCMMGNPSGDFTIDGKSPATTACTSTGTMACAWASGEVTCPVAWQVPSTDPSTPTVYARGCCAGASFGDKPACGVVTGGLTSCVPVPSGAAAIASP